MSRLQHCSRGKACNSLHAQFKHHSTSTRQVTQLAAKHVRHGAGNVQADAGAGFAQRLRRAVILIEDLRRIGLTGTPNRVGYGNGDNRVGIGSSARVTSTVALAVMKAIRSRMWTMPIGPSSVSL